MIDFPRRVRGLTRFVSFSFQVLSLFGSHGLDRPTVEDINKSRWGIPRVLLPHVRTEGEPEALEVDSDLEFD